MREGVGILINRMRRKALAACDFLRYGWGHKGHLHTFVVVSCQRNSREGAISCLDSVYYQEYPRHLVQHIFIDDASDDGTAELVAAWMSAHSDHNVGYIRNPESLGGTKNTLTGMSLADAEAVVVELNGDDWFPDHLVLNYLNRVYADDGVWMTYNSLRLAGGPPVPWARPFSREVIRNNAFRDQQDWTSSALHTFRKRLFDHLPDGVMIDPETGDYWECADDQALYLALLELAGEHSRHIHRITYVYNFRETSHTFKDNSRSVEIARRIRQGRRFEPLNSLD
jgi:glycosyltransferase involved in cell wall biosynthesis